MISDHEIPLAIGLLKGISWVLSYHKSGLLLFNYEKNGKLKEIIHIWTS